MLAPVDPAGVSAKAGSEPASGGLLARTDLALWRLPRLARKALVVPVAFICGVAEAWSDGASEFRYGWRRVMAAVHYRPSELPPDPSEGRGMGGSWDG